MAQVDSTNNPNDPNNPNNPATNPNQVQTPGQTNQPATSGGAGAVTTTGAGNVTGQVTGTNNPAQPFQNIASYLAANAPQSQQLASQVAGTVSAPITQANTDITNAAGNFTSSVNAGYAPENKDLISAVSENPAYVVAENPQNVTNFLGNLNDKYTGPTDFTQAPEYANLESEIAKANSMAANASTPTGVQTLLKGVEGPTTQGINNLDSLLLNQNPANAATIAAAGAPAANLLPTLQSTTQAQNDLAATGSTNAATAAQHAADALAKAQGLVSSNLSNEQNTIQDVVNEYNQSVNVINPVVADITSAIQNFLAQNPNITFPAGTDPMAALENIASIAMPEEAAYASPQDYAQIAALIQLGDTNTGNLPISPATANLAQTFQVPQQLQDALGKAPGVEQALQSELEGFGNQINSAVKPFTDAETAAYNYNVYGLPALQKASADQKTIAGIQSQIATLKTQRGADPKAIQALQDKLNATTADMAQQKATAAQYPNASWDAVAPIAQGLQWVNGTETAYQALIDAINGDLGKLGSVGAPSITYGPNTVTDPVTGAPIGQVVGKGLEQSAVGAAPAAVGAGLADAYAAGQAASYAGDALVNGGYGEGTAIVGSEDASAPLSAAGQLGEAGSAGVTGALQALPPAALAAYGTTNIEQNIKQDPVKSLAMIGGNMLSLGALSIPPKVWHNIESDIATAANQIGSFFGHLF
jgi:hypothetical protein